MGDRIMAALLIVSGLAFIGSIIYTIQKAPKVQTYAELKREYRAATIRLADSAVVADTVWQWSNDIDTITIWVRNDTMHIELPENAIHAKYHYYGVDKDEDDN